MVLYCSPECIGYVELEQARKYMTICFYPFRSIRKQIWPCHKNNQGQPSVIIWINLVVLEYLMLYTKFQGHQPLGSEEGDFWSFLPYVGLKAILVMWPGTFEPIFMPTSHGGPIWNLASKGLVFFEEKKFENVLSDHGQRSWPWPWVVINRHVFIYLTLRTNFYLNFYLTGFNLIS